MKLEQIEGELTHWKDMCDTFKTKTHKTESKIEQMEELIRETKEFATQQTQSFSELRAAFDRKEVELLDAQVGINSTEVFLKISIFERIWSLYI